MHSFIFFTEEAAEVIQMLPFRKIYSGQGLVISQEPQKGMNPRWDIKLPHDRGIYRLNTPETKWNPAS